MSGFANPTAKPLLQRGGYPRDGTKFESKEEHLNWRGTWIARRGCGFVRKKHSGKNSWWVCERCGCGGFKCVRGRRPVLVNGVVQKGKMVYTSFTYEEVRPCDCGVYLGPPKAGDVYGRRVALTAACRRLFGSGNYKIVETGSSLTFSCKHCDGRVVGRLSRTLSSNRIRGFGAPVKVLEVTECKDWCRRLVPSLIKAAEDCCFICQDDVIVEPPSASAVRLVGCCNNVMCRTCLEMMVAQRPRHLKPDGFKQTYVMRFDPSPENAGDHYYSCPYVQVHGSHNDKCQKWYATYEIERYVASGAGEGAWEKTTLQELVRIPKGFIFDPSSKLDRPEYDAAVLENELREYKAHMARIADMPVMVADPWFPSNGNSAENPVSLELD